MKLSNMTFVQQRVTRNRRVWRNTEGSCEIHAYDRLDKDTTVPMDWKTTHIWVSAMVWDEFYGGIECSLDGVEAFVFREIMDLANAYGLKGKALIFKLEARKFFDSLKPRATLARFHAYKNSKEG